MDIVIDTGVSIVTTTPVYEIAEDAVVVTASQFKNAPKWWTLVGQGSWIPVKTNVDTALFSDALECKMGHAQLEQTKSCVWDRTKILAKDDYPNKRFWRAIPCDDGMHYVVGSFYWR